MDEKLIESRFRKPHFTSLASRFSNDGFGRASFRLLSDDGKILIRREPTPKGVLFPSCKKLFG